VADAERLGIALALHNENEEHPLAILTDSQAAIDTLHNLAKGSPPRSDIEKMLKDALCASKREIGILWVRSHIGIEGNEKADRRADLEMFRGSFSGDPGMTTFEGLREKGKDRRKSARTALGFGKHRSSWGKDAVAANTWTRTNRGPQKACLHHIGKSPDPSCTCGHPSQDGDHLVFHCARGAPSRRRLLPPGTEKWEDLDDLHWVTEAGEAGGDQEKVEGIEAFFQDLYWSMKGGAVGAEGDGA